jgi:hypothetical protein
MKQLTHWYERPIICALGFHAKKPHPSAPDTYWWCPRCRLIGEYFGR